MNPYEERCARCREQKIDHIRLEVFDPTVLGGRHTVYLCPEATFLSPKDAT